MNSSGGNGGGAWHRLGRALQVRAFRRYFVGMLLSQTGTWIQVVAVGWLVVERTGSGVALGLVSALQFGPILVVGPWAGLLADRSDKRRLLAAVQLALAATSAVLALLDSAGGLTTTRLYAVIALIGILNAIENPTRRSLISDVVPPSAVHNAVGLQTAATTSTRAVGPVIGGVLIATAGTSASFALNAATYLAFAGILVRLPTSPEARGRLERATGQLRAGFARALTDRDLRTTFAMLLAVSLLTFEYEVALPLIADETFAGDALTYGVLFSALSVGNVAGALFTASRDTADERTLSWCCAVLAVATIAAAAAPTMTLMLVGLAVAGGAGASFFTSANTIVQHRSGDAMRGRMLALVSILFLGARPVGGPLVGWVANAAGPRAALAVGAVGAGCALSVGVLAVRREGASRPSASTSDATGECVSPPRSCR